MHQHSTLFSDIIGTAQGKGLGDFSPPPPPPLHFLDGLSLVLLLNGRLDFNREIMEFQLFCLFSFVLGSVFHEHKVSLLNKFEGFLHEGIHL